MSLLSLHYQSSGCVRRSFEVHEAYLAKNVSMMIREILKVLQIAHPNASD